MKNILSHLNASLIEAAYRKAKGNEIESGKFESPESSAALAANVLGISWNQVSWRAFRGAEHSVS